MAAQKRPRKPGSRKKEGYASDSDFDVAPKRPRIVKAESIEETMAKGERAIIKNDTESLQRMQRQGRGIARVPRMSTRWSDADTSSSRIHAAAAGVGFLDTFLRSVGDIAYNAAYEGVSQVISREGIIDYFPTRSSDSDSDSDSESNSRGSSISTSESNSAAISGTSNASTSRSTSKGSPNPQSQQETRRLDAPELDNDFDSSPLSPSASQTPSAPSQSPSPTRQQTSSFAIPGPNFRGIKQLSAVTPNSFRQIEEMDTDPSFDGSSEPSSAGTTPSRTGRRGGSMGSPTNPSGFRSIGQRGEMGPPPLPSSSKPVEQAGDIRPLPLPLLNAAPPLETSLSSTPLPPREPNTRLPQNFTPTPHRSRRGGPNPLLHLEHLLTSFVQIHTQTNIFSYTHANQLHARKRVFEKSLELMEALTSLEVRVKLRPLFNRVRSEEWRYANFAVGRVERVVAGTQGLIVFREGVWGVASLSGRLGVLSVLWDELREEGVRFREGLIDERDVDGLVRNEEGKAEGTVWGKVVPDLRLYLGISAVLRDLTEAMDMANGVGGVRQVVTWDLEVDDEDYVEGGED